MGNFIKNYLFKVGIGILAGLLLAGALFVIDEVQMKPKIEELAGTWEGEFESDLSWQETFESFEFCEAELNILRDKQLLDGNATFVDVATFTKDRKFSISSNNDKTGQLIRTYIDSAFNAMYADRTRLNSEYNADFTFYAKADFLEFYADMYACDSYELLLDVLVESICDYYIVQEGTYKIDDDLIVLKINDVSEKTSIEYKLEEGMLYLTWATEDDKPLVVEYKRVG